VQIIEKGQRIQMDGCLCQIMQMDEGINDMFANF
jgi:hypothetical protein